jgi:LmbE family N-acetylglucosaminyl deacetylase
MARHVANGDEVHVVFMADGVSSRNESKNADLEKRNRARDKAMGIIGVEHVHTLNFPDNRMDTVPLLDVVQALEKIISQVNPTRVYTHQRNDLNVDHQITHQAVLTACRPVPGSVAREILAFEVMSSTEWSFSNVLSFTPNAFVDIGDFLNCKIRAMKAYNMELRPSPHPRSVQNIKAMATFRGNVVGLDAAEAFTVIRITI